MLPLYLYECTTVQKIVINGTYFLSANVNVFFSYRLSSVALSLSYTICLSAAEPNNYVSGISMFWLPDRIHHNVPNGRTHLSPVQDGIFRSRSRMGRGTESLPHPHPKICFTYPTKTKCGTVLSCLKKIEKYMNHVTHPLSSAYIYIFSPEISKFCYIKEYR